jgi:hypothetical protein
MHNERHTTEHLIKLSKAMCAYILSDVLNVSFSILTLACEARARERESIGKLQPTMIIIAANNTQHRERASEIIILKVVI